MANRITGSTDTTSSISIRARSMKSVLLVCEKAATGSATAEQIYPVSGTSDAYTKFGEKVSKLVKILINNGVDNIKCVAIGEYGADEEYTDKASAYAAAMNASLVDKGIMVIITDSTDATVASAMKTHLAVAESEDMFRYGVVGLSATTIEEAVAEVSSINSERVFAPFPHFVDDSGIVLDGAYGAAGMAALILTETSDPAMPMNNVEFRGFGGTSMVLLKSDRTTLEQAGITAIVGGSTPTIWRLVTTRLKSGETGDPTWHDGTTIFIADNVLESVITTLQSTYKRTKNTSRILNAIRTTVIGILEAKEGLEIIENFDKNTVSVVQDPEDIYGAVVDYEFDVVTPLYTITITQHMKL